MLKVLVNIIQFIRVQEKKKKKKKINNNNNTNYKVDNIKEKKMFDNKQYFCKPFILIIPSKQIRA